MIHAVDRIIESNRADGTVVQTAACACGWAAESVRLVTVTRLIIGHLTPHDPEAAMGWTHALVDFQIEELES